MAFWTCSFSRLGYQYLARGVPLGIEANPDTIGAVKLGYDMISLAGNAINIKCSIGLRRFYYN